MPNYIELPQDEFGNRAFIGKVNRVISAELQGDVLRITQPADFPWPTVSLYGWLAVNHWAGIITEREWVSMILAANPADVPDWMKGAALRSITPSGYVLVKKGAS